MFTKKSFWPTASQNIHWGLSQLYEMESPESWLSRLHLKFSDISLYIKIC